MRALRPMARALAGLLLAGCAASSDSPPPVRYGASPCAECRMLISEARYAAAAFTRAGDPVLFDSIECLVRYLREQGPPLARMWVHDYETDRWVTAERAFYVASAEIATPMGQGVVATAGADEAGRLAGAMHGRVLRFAQLDGVINGAATSH